MKRHHVILAYKDYACTRGEAYLWQKIFRCWSGLGKFRCYMQIIFSIFLINHFVTQIQSFFLMFVGLSALLQTPLSAGPRCLPAHVGLLEPDRAHRCRMPEWARWQYFSVPMLRLFPLQLGFPAWLFIFSILSPYISHAVYQAAEGTSTLYNCVWHLI